LKDNPSYKISEAEKKAGQRDRHNMIVRRVCVDMARRTRLEACPEDWLKYYMGQAFRLSWADSHKAMIHNAIASAESGSGMVVAAPRGDGKSAILRGVALYLLLTGRINFPLVAPWTARNATAHFKAWIKFISEKGSRLSEDYPEYLQPFEISTNTAKLKHLKWEDTGELIGAEVSAADKQIILPDSLGAIMTASVNGDIKGTQVTLKSGEIIRPDLLMLDDAQDAKRADNPEAVQDMIDVIESEWFCLAGPDTSLTVFNACTVKHKNDVSEYFLRHPDFKAVRIARVITWPEGWEDDKSESWQHWHEWNNIRTSKGRNERNAYYLEHKDVMIKGFTVSWSDRFDKKKQEIDAYQSAMIAYFRFGKKAFFSEYQNDPIVDGIDVYTITPDIITSRTVDRDPFTLPEWSEVVVSATDINPSYALSSATYAFGKDRTAACLWYGLFEDAPLPTRMDMSETQKEQIIYGALKIHGEQMLKQRHGKVWAIDGGGAQSTVAKRFMYEWNRAHPEMQAVVCYGRSGKSARISARNETIRRRATDGSWILCRDKDPVYGWTEWVLWNSDHWREIMQRAWTCETGAPGGATLPRGHHREYAEHICRDKLKGKIELNGKMFFDYEKAPGRNDLGDATNMCWMLADLQGIGNGNGVVRQQQSRPQRRIRHVAI
jgi:hypothetical protein